MEIRNWSRGGLVRVVDDRRRSGAFDTMAVPDSSH
jgi:hypothetical protein